MTTQIRVAVIGAGVFGRHHLRILKNSPRADLIAVLDTDPQRAASPAKIFRGRRLQSISRFFVPIPTAAPEPATP